ncbi:MAG TPA: hypothetical protein VF041_14025 [Gemmatimonadaceae bacterium]
MSHTTTRARPARRSLAVVLVGSALALALATAPATAQTRFAWPDTTVDVSKYTTVDLCLAAVSRAQHGVDVREALSGRRDTILRDPRDQLKPLPAPVTDVATRCAARFPEATAKLEDFAPLLALYLVAGRDTDATALVARRLAVVPAKSKPERRAVEDTTIRIYLAARPARLDAAERILVARAHEGGTDRMDRMEIYTQLMKSAAGVGDTARARRVARWIVAVADSLTPAERESEKFEGMGGGGGKFLVFDAVQELVGLQVMLDSLRHSTAALVALERNTWAAQLHERPEALPIPIGERAPTIKADYWLPAEAASTPRPAPGHASFVIFLDDKDCLRFEQDVDAVSDGCGSELATLHRFSERFPTLDITIVSSTHGHFVYAPPMTPAEEAGMIRNWLEPYHIPRLTVAVTSTPFWNLPSPDGRRIENPTANQTSYSFAKQVQPQSAEYLIDQDGILVTVFSRNESELAQFIDVLVHRQTGGEHAAK